MLASDARVVFQPGNLHNQQEHLLQMLANRAQRIHKLRGEADMNVAICTATQEVFLTRDTRDTNTPDEPIGTFDSYMIWCNHMRIPCTDRFLGEPLRGTVGGKPGHRGPHGEGCRARHAEEPEEVKQPEEVQQHQLENLALWWSLWGEAASMRFMPELLFFVFFCAVSTAKADKEDHTTQMFGHVVQPVFDFLKKQMGQKQGGRALDHESKMNYDDVNEFFWGAEGKQAVDRVLLDQPLDAGLTRIVGEIKRAFGGVGTTRPRENATVVENYLPASILDPALVAADDGDAEQAALLKEVLPAYAERSWLESVHDSFERLKEVEEEYPEPEVEADPEQQAAMEEFGKKSHSEKRGVFHGIMSNARVWLTYAVMMLMLVTYAIQNPFDQEGQCRETCVPDCGRHSTGHDSTACTSDNACDWNKEEETCVLASIDGEVDEHFCYLKDDRVACTQTPETHCKVQTVCEGESTVANRVPTPSSYHEQYPYAFTCGMDDPCLHDDNGAVTTGAMPQTRCKALMRGVSCRFNPGWLFNDLSAHAFGKKKDPSLRYWELCSNYKQCPDHKDLSFITARDAGGNWHDPDGWSGGEHWHLSQIWRTQPYQTDVCVNYQYNGTDNPLPECKVVSLTRMFDWSSHNATAEASEGSNDGVSLGVQLLWLIGFTEVARAFREYTITGGVSCRQGCKKIFGSFLWPVYRPFLWGLIALTLSSQLLDWFITNEPTFLKDVDDGLEVFVLIFLLVFVAMFLWHPGWVAHLPIKVRRNLTPDWMTFAGGEMTTSWATVFYTSFFWVVLIVAKCFVSLYLEIYPAIKLTVLAWQQAEKRKEQNWFWCEHDIAGVRSGIGGVHQEEDRVWRALFLTLMIWVPVWFLFLLDLQVMYTVLQSVCGLMVGMSRGVGGATFAASPSDFAAREFDQDDTSRGLRIKANFDRRLNTNPGISESRVRGSGAARDGEDEFSAHTALEDDFETHRQDMNLQKLNEISGEKIKDAKSPVPKGSRKSQGIPQDRNLFRKTWNEMVREYRVADLCTFEDEFILKMPKVWRSMAATKNTALFAVIGSYEYGKLTLRDNGNVKDWWKTTNQRVKVAVSLVCSVALTILHNLLGLRQVNHEALPNFERMLDFKIPHPGGQDGTHPWDEESCDAFEDDLQNSVAGTKLSNFGEKCLAIVDAITTLKDEDVQHKCTDALRKLRLVTSKRPKSSAGVKGVEKAVKDFLQFASKNSNKGGLGHALFDQADLPRNFDVAARTAQFLTSHDGPPLVGILHHLLRTPLREALPENEEVRRRLHFYTRSLTMNMPKAHTVDSCLEFSTLVPMYGEEVMYTKTGMDSKKASDGILSLLDFIKVCEPEEYKHMQERVNEEENGGLSLNHSRSGLDQDSIFEWQLDDRENDPTVHANRLWVSERNQTLCRTIRGMHNYERALRSLAEFELLTGGDRDDIAKLSSELARQKHCFVVSCQIFGGWANHFKNEMKRRQGGKDVKDSHEDAQKFEAVCWLMHRYKHLRIAFIEEGHEGCFSVLVKHGRTMTDIGELKYEEVYRVRLPGNPIRAGIGEGKPENQNHAVIFTRGPFLQTIDMNQDGYYEEALKMRNLLEEFYPNGSATFANTGLPACIKKCTADKPVTIVGFSEHQFSRKLGSAGEFAALEELSFATMAQRAMNCPFQVRYHYGHPDVHHRIRATTRGGIAKANKTVCVSEDVYGGWNAMQRGGRILFREYIHVGKGKDLHLDQVAAFQAKIASGSAECALSRDYTRATETQSLPRLLAFFHTGNGFFWSNVIIVWTTQWTIYSYLVMSILLDDDEETSSTLRYDTSQTVGWLQIGFMLSLPLLLELVLLRGPFYAIFNMFKLVCTGAPVFYLFQICWKSYIYMEALTLPAAQYRATGRGVVLQRMSFVTIWTKYAYSHFCKYTSDRPCREPLCLY